MVASLTDNSPLQANIGALASRGIDLRAHARQWLASGAAGEPARDPGGAPAIRIPPEMAGKPVYIEGSEPLSLLARIAELAPAQADGYEAPIHLVEPNVGRFLGALSRIDVSGLLASPRVRVFLGEAALEGFSRFLRERLGFELRGLTLGLPGATGAVKQAVDRASADQAGELERIVKRNAARYAGRGAAYWRDRYQAATASAGEDRLRVLVLTTRYSTFVRHSSDDIARALAEAGCHARVLAEPDGSSRFTPLAYAQQVESFEPDLVVLINYTRVHLRGAIPESCPFMCWIQDAMHHLFDPAVGAAQGELDFLVGHLHGTLFREFHYPRRRAMHLPVLASRAKFHDGPVEAPLLRDHECEIACATNQSQTPEELRDGFLAGAGHNHALVRAIGELYDAIAELIADINISPFPEDLEGRAGEILVSNGLPADAKRLTTILNQIARPLADRMLRHQTLAWAAEICAARGWRFHLYGAGWERHPALGAFARGELEHGEPLRASYRSARCHLHASVNGNVHQRIAECALSGGLPLCRLKYTDVMTLASFGAARLHLLHASREPDRAGVEIPARINDDAQSLAVFAQLQRLGEHYVERGASHAGEIGTVRLKPGFRASPFEYWGGVMPHPDLAWLMGDLCESCFFDRPQLERIAEKAVESDTWRDDLRRGIRRRALSQLTYEGAAERLIGLVAGSFAPRDAEKRSA